MQQSSAANPIDTAIQDKIIKVSANRYRRLHFHSDLFPNGFSKIRYLRAQLIENERSHSGSRQNAGCVHHFQRAFRFHSVQRIVKQPLLNYVAVERMQIEWLAILKLFFLSRQLDSQSLPQEKFRGM